jgi:hypothetical protein
VNNRGCFLSRPFIGINFALQMTEKGFRQEKQMEKMLSNSERFILQTFSTLFKFDQNLILIFWRGGRNVDDQNVDRPKISERRNGLFS